MSTRPAAMDLPSVADTPTATETQTVQVTTTATTRVASGGADLVFAVSLTLAAVVVAVGLVAFALVRRRGPEPTPG